MAAVEPHVPAGSAPGEKGVRGDALGMISSIVIGVASTAPGYSLAASFGSAVLELVQRSSTPLLVVPRAEIS